MKFRRPQIISTAAAVSIILAACGGAATPAPAPTQPPAATEASAAPAATEAPAVSGGSGLFEGTVPEPANKDALAQVSGEIIIDGSSTVYPVTAAAAEEFRKYAPNARISVGISGTGGGFKKFCAGETDISDASRPILPAEVEACKANNIEFVEIPVAFDGLAVVVHPNNDITCMKVSELKKIWEPEAQDKITNWSQVDPKYGDRPLVLFGAGTDSGTFDYFTDAINGKEKASRGDYQGSEDDNVLVQGVGGDENAMGFFGYAYVVENQDKIKPMAIDYDVNSKTGEPTKFAGACVAPSFATVKDGTYQPLSRPIFIYVKKEAAARPEVKAFIDFYLSPSFTPLIQSREVGYVELDHTIYEAVAKRFNDGVLGTLFPNGQEIGATLDRYLK
jgi:phosphate binding protein